MQLMRLLTSLPFGSSRSNLKIVVADKKNKGLGDDPFQMRFLRERHIPKGRTPKTGLVPVITRGCPTPF